MLTFYCFSGHIAERMDLRKFLAFGMITSGIFTALFGLGRYWNIHSLWFYMTVQVLHISNKYSMVEHDHRSAGIRYVGKLTRSRI